MFRGERGGLKQEPTLNRGGRMDARMGQNKVTLHQRAARLSLARRNKDFNPFLEDEMRPLAKKESLETVFENIQAQRELTEALHVCDVLERLIDDPEQGFDEGLFVACEQFIAQSEQWEEENPQVVLNSNPSENNLNRKSSSRRQPRSSLMKFSDYFMGADLEKEKEELQAQEGVVKMEPETFQQKAMLFFENPSSSVYSRIYFVFMTLTVLSACVFVVIETLPQYNPVVNPEMTFMWQALDWTVTLIFTAETVTRLVLHIFDDSARTSKIQNAWMFLKRPSNILDIIALLPTYVEMMLSGAGRVVSGVLRTARLLRLLKFLRRFRPIRRLVTALRRSAASLLAPFLFLALCLLLFGAWLFFTERGTFNEELGSFVIEDPQCTSEPYGFLEKFANITRNSTIAGQQVETHCPLIEPKFISITQTLWWGIVTFTTVGFGDLVPITDLGKGIASLGMIAGLIFIAMPIAVLGTNYTLVMEQKVIEKERRREALARTKPITKNEKPPAYKLPGENFLEYLTVMCGKDVIDLRDPGDDVLFLMDKLLESSVKQLTSMVSQSDSETVDSNAGPFPMKYNDLGLPLDRLPMWLARVHHRFPGGEKPDKQKASEPQIGRKSLERRKSEILRGLKSGEATTLKKTASASGRVGSDGRAPCDFNKWSNVEEDDKIVTISRPVTMRVGSDYRGQASALRPDITIYDEPIAKHLYVMQTPMSKISQVTAATTARESGGGGNTNEVDLEAAAQKTAVSSFSKQKSTSDPGSPGNTSAAASSIMTTGTSLLQGKDADIDLDEIPLVPVATSHFTITRTIMWGEHRVLLRPHAGCPIAVLRLKNLESERARLHRKCEEGYEEIAGDGGGVKLDVSVDPTDPFFGVKLPFGDSHTHAAGPGGTVRSLFFYKAGMLGPSRSAKYLPEAIAPSPNFGKQLEEPDYHVVGHFNLKMSEVTKKTSSGRYAQVKSQQEEKKAAIKSALNPDTSDQIAKQQHTSAVEHLEKVAAGEIPYISLQDGDTIVVGTFIPHHLPYLLTAMVEGDHIPAEVGGQEAAEKVLLYHYGDNSSNFMV